MKKYILLLLAICFSLSFYAQETEKTAEEVPINKESSTEIPFEVIEKVPVYQGCNSNSDNRELKDCMANAIRRHVAKKFNTDLATELDLYGRIKIYAFFKIDTKGNVIDISARAPHPRLEEEAIRVISLIPTLESPGYLRNKPVIVPYNLPIVFMVEAPTLTKKEMRKQKRRNKR